MIIFIIVFGLSLALLIRNVFIIAFSMQDYSIHKKRLKQLKFGEEEDNDLDGLLKKITDPIIEHVLPKITIRNRAKIKRDLRFAGWDKHLNVSQFIAIKLITKAIGVTMGLMFFRKSVPFALVWFILPFFAVQFLLNNTAKNKKEELLMGFSDFIRITQGNLSSGMPFVKSVEESIVFVSDTWKPILEKFVVEAELNNIDKAIEGLKEDADIFEVKEFMSLVSLTLEQGGSAVAGFESQAEKIQQMIKYNLLLKIGKRKMLGIAIQLPLLLCNIAVIGLPTVYAFTELNL